MHNIGRKPYHPRIDIRTETMDRFDIIYYTMPSRIGYASRKLAPIKL